MVLSYFAACFLYGGGMAFSHLEILSFPRFAAAESEQLPPCDCYLNILCLTLVAVKDNGRKGNCKVRLTAR